MLEYGLPKIDENERWFIKQDAYSPEYRYLHLQTKKWWGWKTVKKEMISTSRMAGTFEYETKQAAHEIIRDIEVNFNLPVGEVR